MASKKHRKKIKKNHQTRTAVKIIGYSVYNLTQAIESLGRAAELARINFQNFTHEYRNYQIRNRKLF